MVTKGRWRITALLGAGVLTLTLLLTTCGSWSGDGTEKVGGTGRQPAQVARSPQLGWGFTHTQYSADTGTAQAKRRAHRLLTAQPMPQNQHIMGWGADNPEPSPGRYDFEELDQRVELMRATGATPVLTLCCAPDWMKGGQPGTTDWSKESLETAPTPDHYDDFAELAGTVAARYPDVRHFIVWNEFKGFYDDDKKRWDYEGYTRLYNLVYRELKKRDPDNLVGGPYVVVDSDPPGTDQPDSDLPAGDRPGRGAPGEPTGTAAVAGPWGVLDQRSVDAISYWNQHKAGADFVVVDGSSYTREDDELIPDEFAATEKFADVTRWLRRLTGLPVWWAEWYVEPPDAADRRDGWSERHRVAVQATAMTELARGGADTALYWNPQQTGTDCPGCLWSSTSLADGGRGLPMNTLLTRFAREFPPGTDLRPVRVAAGDRDQVRALASKNALVVVNTGERPLTTTVDGRPMTLEAYQVRWLTW